MKKANLFIVGAPKCGTTALFSYLEKHPGIFAPDFKELRFFCDDKNVNRISSMEAYLKAFAGARESHRYLCDASPGYLMSEAAIPGIYRFNPEAKLIAMLRHPADLFFSMHGQAYYTFNEDVSDPEIAWRLQDVRAEGKSIPATCRDPINLQYKTRCTLSVQLERMFAVFPREQILLISLDELKKDPKALYEKVLAFLGLKSDGRTEFPKENSSKTHRNRVLGRFLISRRKEFFDLTNSTLTNRSAIKSVVLRVCRRLGSAIRKWNTVPYKRPAPRPEFISELLEIFQPEVDRLKSLTGLELKSSFEQ
jgi:hypothetical protein